MSTFAENFCHRDGQKSWLRICAQHAELRFFFPVRGIAIDVDVHVVEKNHVQNLARTFVTPLGDFHMFLSRDGPGRGHRLCKRRNTPKQTRLRKALLHYFSRSLRHKGQQGSAIVSALKTGCASRPIFSKVMLPSDQKWIIALTHHCLACRFYEVID